MRPRTALLIGGPRDGDLLAIEDGRHTIAVPMPESGFPARYALGVSEAAFRSGAYREEAFAVRTRHYVRERVHLFGRALDVWVFDGVTRSERDEAVARHVLSPVALGLLGGQR